MSAFVKVLVEGYTNAGLVGESGEERTQPTVSLVADGDIKMVVDPGILNNPEELILALEKEGLGVDDINLVCITHSHIDHYRNIGMFPRAKVLEYYGVWDKDGAEEWHVQFSPHIQILKTPGHDRTAITLFVSTDKGVVAICGDVFWKENYPELPRDDIYASDLEELVESRRQILKRADWIIPGHAGIYKVNRGLEASKKRKRLEAEKLTACKRCHRLIKNPEDRCLCRLYLCYRCCECHIDCDLCSCSHKKR